MGGFILDIALVFLVRSFTRAIRLVKSVHWERRSASVLDSEVLDPDIGCPSVLLHYKVGSDGAREGRDEIPFFLRRSAERCAKRLLETAAVTIRVNPSRATDMLFFKVDQ